MNTGNIIINLLFMTIQMSTPYLLVVMGGIFVQHTGVFNIALEGSMEFGAFAATLCSRSTRPMRSFKSYENINKCKVVAKSVVLSFMLLRDAARSLTLG